MSGTLLGTFGTEQPDERLRTELRKATLSSTYAFAQFICGIRDMDPLVHGEMAAWSQRNTRRKLGLWPRDFMKTNVTTIADTLRRATADPHSKTLLINEVIANTSKWIMFMQGIVDTEIYRWLFPEVVPDFNAVRWNSTQLELKRSQPVREATVEGIGVGGASTSNHYGLIREDDTIGMEARESPAVMQKAIDQHIANESLVEKGGLIDTRGTRWHANDLADWMFKHERGLDYIRRSIEYLDQKTGEMVPFWPGGFPRERIEELRAKEPTWWFALQRMNDVLASGATEFDGRWLREYSETTIPLKDGSGSEPAIVLQRTPEEGGTRLVRLSDCTKFQVCDMGLSPESPDARTANVVAAITPPIVDGQGVEIDPFQIVILAARAQKCDPHAATRAAYECYEQFDPSIAAIEVFGAHVVYFNWLAHSYPKMRLVKLPTDTKKSKLTRIREFYPFATQGRLWVPRGTAYDLRIEWVAFPTGITVDLLDALAYLPRIWWEPDPQNEYGERAERLLPGMSPDDARRDAALEAEAELTRSPVTGY